MTTTEPTWAVEFIGGKYKARSVFLGHVWSFGGDIKDFFPEVRAKALVVRLNAKSPAIRMPMDQIVAGLASGDLKWEKR